MTKPLSLPEILHLDELERDHFEGIGPSYPWGGLYGGQILAQGLIAAIKSVSEGDAPDAVAFSPHSIHAYFIRSGTMAAPVQYRVERIRDGRSFSTRRVEASQDGSLIAAMICSFQRPERSLDLQREAPAFPRLDDDLEELRRDRWSPLVDRLYLPKQDDGTHSALMKFDERLGDDPALHLGGLAFLSDDLPTESVGVFRPEGLIPGQDAWPFFSASLDHSIHFHAPFRVDEYHLHAFKASRFSSGRGLARGEIFSADGVHVASVSQEILLREER